MTNELDETESEHDSENGIESMLEEAHKTRPSSRQLVQEILNQPGELPIQAFYKRFPWLCKRTQPQKEKGSEPNRRGIDLKENRIASPCIPAWSFLANFHHFSAVFRLRECTQSIFRIKLPLNG
jgi:hypothetical protein